MRIPSLRLFLAAVFVAQFACAANVETKADFIDTSVSGFRLLDEKSYTGNIGENTKFLDDDKVVYTQHYNQTGFEMLTVMSRPDAKFVPIRFQVAKLDRKFIIKRHVMSTVSRFTTEKGIHLGMRSAEVTRLLGAPAFTHVTEDGVTIHRYQIQGKEISTSMKGSNLPSYESEYHFLKDELVEFKFGI